ncbi:hypothetical protein [Cupriavidus basilensis]|uniref:hypothetical protein n=1 Tax=Cupriavidus basilensis TaxID=68895 RepID=UPI001E5BD70D|nr:hypothetical protein [Cupriavidus basilensis]
MYGVLHGLTGGTNLEYKGHVERAIASAPGLIFGEMRFIQMYCGIEVDMDDWTEIPLADAFRMQLKATISPLRLWRVQRTRRAERKTVTDRFGADGVRRLQDIGGSMAFHALHPTERRQIAGFLSPGDYLVENCLRRRGLGRTEPPAFPDGDWHWMQMVEPQLNIPLRSVFMLEFAVERARAIGVEEISIFVGEIHNSDMQWLATWDAGTAEDTVRVTVDGVRRRARALARTTRRPSRIGFVLASLAGTMPALLAYAVVGAWILR